MRRPIAQTVTALLAITAAIVGQQLLPQLDWTIVGVGYFAIAIVAFLWLLVSQPASESLPAPHETEEAMPRVSLYGSSLSWRLGLGILIGLSAVIAFRYLANNRFTTVGTLSWLTSIIGFVCLFWELPSDWRERSKTWWGKRPFLPPYTFTIHRRHLILLAIFLLAAFFRFYRLDSLPKEMGSDQAEKLFDVYDVLSGMRPVFFARNTGREAFQFYWTAAIIKLTGQEIGYLPLKMGTALLGLLAVPWVYLLAKELYGRSVSLIATTFFALSSWHTAISRIGLRFPFTPLFATATLYYLIRTFKYGRRNDWLLTGLTLGIGLHTYIPMRMVPLLLVLLALIKLGLDTLPVIGKLVNRKRQPTAQPTTDYRLPPTDYSEASALNWAYWQNAILGACATLLVFLPLLRYMVDDPQMFWYRVTTRSLENGNTLPGESWRIFWDNVKNALLMFNYKGDPVPSNSIPFTPFLGLVSGGLFVLGTVYILWRLLKWRDRRSIYVLVTIFVLLLPSILSLEFPGENPSRVRTGGAIPWAMLVAALPLWLVWQQLQTNWKRAGKWMVGLGTAVLFLLAFRDNYNYYFVRYDTHYHNSLWNTSEIGAAARGWANSVGDMEHVYHVPYPYWVDTRLIGIYAGAIPWENSIPDFDAALPQQIIDPAPKLYILHLLDTEHQERLQLTYPQGWFERYESAVPTKDFMLFFVPPR
ncbi:MAG: glycosyltransferase family 39 protein [Ardenticatenaceae bacterium]|nr:glycosyltransferase family 39 protein [Ardenticatenaceae bacterium]